MGGDFNADVIINIPPAFFSLQKSGLVRVYLTSVFLLLSVPRCFGDQKPQFDSFLKLLLAIGPLTTPVQKTDMSVLSQIHSGTLSWIEDESPVPAKAAEVKYISSVKYLSGSTA